MNKRNILSLLFLIAGMVATNPAVNSIPNQDNHEQSSYLMVRHVIGSGGVTSSSGTKYFHAATAGEPVIGYSQSSNYFHLTGFWQTGIFVSTAVATDEQTTIPTDFLLQQNYPNPFNPETTIRFSIPATVGASVPVVLKIYNLQGQLIRTLLNDNKSPGYYCIIWDGLNSDGESVGSGVYLYTVSAGKFYAGKKMILLR